MRGEAHPSRAAWATIVAGEQRSRKGHAVALQQGTWQAMKHRAGLTWQGSPAHWGRYCGHRHLAARTPSLVPPQQRAAVAGMAVSSCLSRCLPCQAAAGCWSCSPQGPWDCQTPGGGSGSGRGSGIQVRGSLRRGWCWYLALGGVADTPDSGYHGEGSRRLIGAWLPRNSLVCK